MGTVGKIARRTFLVGSAAIVGGVAFGTYLAKKAIPNPLLDDLASGEAAITPFVKVTKDGIELTTPRADKGQGSYSVQADMISEELDIDPATALITPGQPHQAYYNGTVLQEGTPFAAYDQSKLAETARAFMNVPAKILEMQLTGGSSTVPDMFDKLRMAGAVARETLKQAASVRTGIPRADLRTKDGQVILPDGGLIPYTDLAAEAADVAPITDVTLRSPDDWVILGKPRERRDIVAKSTGAETYGIDFRLPDMLYASVRANPAIGGNLNSYDAADAKAMQGVQKVMEVSNGIAVIASNTWYAIEAVNAVECYWGDGSYPATSDQIWDAMNATLENEDRLDHRNRNDGDVDNALADKEVIEAAYRIPFLAHAPLEPMNATVRVTDELCEIWTGTQIPGFIRDHAMGILGFDRDQVKVHVLPMGGSFGHRLEGTHVAQAVEIAAAMKGTPIKMTWSREEDMTHDYPRSASVARARGAVSNGQVDTLDLSVAQPAMAPAWIKRLTGLAVPGPDLTITTGAWDQPFAIPNYRVSGYRAPDMVPVSSWRSVGASGNGFYHDCFLDELIHAASADPLEERLRLCHHDASRKVLEAVGEMSGWDGPSLGDNRGRGVAFVMSFGVPVAQVIEVTNTEDGIRLDKAFVAADVGPAVLDPTNTDAQLFGGTLFGLSHAINSELTYDAYAPEQNNFDGYESMRLYQAPEIEVKALTNGTRLRGIGEPAVPPAAPALGNAIFAATGQRIRQMPFYNHIDFI